MATGTAYYNLTKPASTENYNLGVWNTNLDMIDAQMHQNETETFTGATSLANGTVGNVPAPLIADKDKYLKGDGTWDTPSGGGGGSTVTITPTLSSGTKIADYSIDGVSDSLYAPSGGGGGGVNYSTSEQDTGLKWIDNKPIYQKTIHYSETITSSAIIDNLLTTSNTDYFICTELSYIVNNSYRGNGFQIEVNITSNGVAVDKNNAPGGVNSISDIYATIRYTKASS